MTPDERWSRASSLKARIAALICLSAVPLLEAEARWGLLLAGAFTLAGSAATDTPRLRARTLFACAAGMAYSFLLGLVVDDPVIRVAIFMIAIVVLGLYIHRDGSRPEDASIER